MKPYAMAWEVTPAIDLDDDHKAEYQKTKRAYRQRLR
jgi:hypothetical protein